MLRVNRRRKRRLSSQVRPAEQRILLSGTPTEANPSSLSLDGASWLDLGNPLNHEFNDITVSAWFNTNDRDEFQTIVSNGYSEWTNQYWLGITGGKLELRTRPTSSIAVHRITASDQLENGHWYHVAAVFNRNDSTENDELSLYLDGQLVGAGAKDIHNLDSVEFKNFAGTLGSLDIGHIHNNTGAAFHGLIDDVRIYHDVLTQEQIDHLGLYTGSTVDVGAEEIAYWKFDNSNDPTLEETGTYAGTLGGYASLSTSAAAPIVSEVNPSSLSLDGASWLDLGNPLNHGDNDVSVSAWFNTNDRDQYQAIIANGYSQWSGQYWLGLAAGKLRLTVKPVGATSPYIITTAEQVDSHDWYHVAFTINRNDDSQDDLISLYLNGELKGNKNIQALDHLEFKNLNDPHGSLDIGKKHSSSDNFTRFNGYIDDVRIYHDVLTQEQIDHLGLYAGSTAVIGVPEIAYWKFDDSNDPTYEETGTYAGTLEGNATLGGDAAPISRFLTEEIAANLVVSNYEAVMGAVVLSDMPALASMVNDEEYEHQNPSQAVKDKVAGLAQYSGDFDGDGVVDFADFLILSGQFGQSVDEVTGQDVADANSDGEIGFADFLVLSANFGLQTYDINDDGVVDLKDFQLGAGQDLDGVGGIDANDYFLLAEAYAAAFAPPYESALWNFNQPAGDRNQLRNSKGDDYSHSSLSSVNWIYAGDGNTLRLEPGDSVQFDNAVDLTTGLAGHWKFDDTGNNTVVDSAGGDNNGTLSGASYAFDPERGDVLEFVDISDDVTIDPNGLLLLAAEWTMAGWFKDLSTANGYKSLIRNAIVVNNSGQLGGYKSGVGFQPSGFTMPNLTGWHHIAAVGKDGSTTYYLDGVEVGTADFQSNTPVDYLGNSAVNNRFADRADDVRVYDRALGASEIRALAPGFSLEQDKTIAFWMKRNSSAANGAIVEKAGEYGIYYGNGNQ